MQRLVLKSFQSPGDVIMLTAAVRDLHVAYPGRFETDIRTSADALWENNPHITHLTEGKDGVQTLDMHYPLIHQSNQRPYHFIHAYSQFLEQQLGLRIPITKFHGDIHLSSAEKQAPTLHAALKLPEHFWIIVAGGKHDFTAKWWNPACYQAVVDHFQGRLHFAQCGESHHWHPPLSGATNLVGRTTLREFVRLMYHAAGVVCPVTFAMHLAAAVETKPSSRPVRPCVVIAGGREPAHWEAYPIHQFLHTHGALACCASGGCWKSRCQLVGDGDPKDSRDVCEQPVQVSETLRIPRCMDLITPDDVIRAIERYYVGATRTVPSAPPTSAVRHTMRSTTTTVPEISAGIQKGPARPLMPVLIKFRHGLGDAVQLTTVLAHLASERPNWRIDVMALVGKHTALAGLCRQTLLLNHAAIDPSQYHQVYDLDWPECSVSYADWPSTKAERCLLDVFQIRPQREKCRYFMQPGSSAMAKADQYYRQFCKAAPDETGRFPVVLIHYEGNTSADQKNLSLDIARGLCEQVIRCGAVPVILDWDRRSPLPDGQRIHNPHVDLELWGGTGTGDAEIVAALIQRAALMIGIDSGPLHVAGATATPTVGVGAFPFCARFSEC